MPLTGCAVCMCGHPIYEHSRQAKDGNRAWMACRITNCACATWRASDGSKWPDDNVGAVPAEPTDLDVDTEHWRGGQVVLAADL